MNCFHRDSDYKWQHQQKHEMDCDIDSHEDIAHAIIKSKQTLQRKDVPQEEYTGMFYAQSLFKNREAKIMGFSACVF